MPQTLSVDNIINVSMTLTPLAAALRGFGGLLILGSTPGVIDTTERIRAYSSIDDVSADFGNTTNEWKAAKYFFQQQPKPVNLFIGRWAQVATEGLLKGGVLSTDEQAISNFTAIATGSMEITIDGTLKTLTGLNFSEQSNLNGIAGALTAELAGAGLVVWNASYNRFEVTSTTTGSSSTVSYAVSSGSGQDISALLKLVTGVASVPVDGVDPETLLDAVTALLSISNDWYGLSIAAAIANDADRLAVSGLIEAAVPSRIVGYTTQSSLTLDGTSTTDTASVLKAKNLSRTFIQYCSDTPFADASLFGRAFTTNFLANKSTITLMFKQEPGIAAENLNANQARALQAKNCNVFAAYNNGTAIIQYGTMSNGQFFDTIYNCDWMQNYIQTNVWNFMLTNPTKTPQTDDGVNAIAGQIEHSLEQGVANQMLAPGIWNGPDIGPIKTGDYLPKGYFIYTTSVDDQATADRGARKAPPIQVALKMAGAIHTVDVLCNVNQ